MVHKPGSDRVPPLIEWVICGGESGPRARPTHPAWARFLRDQCGNADVPFFFKLLCTKERDCENPLPSCVTAACDGREAGQLGAP